MFKAKAFIDSPLVQALKRILNDNGGEIVISPSKLFDKLTYDYSDIDCLPTTPNMLGKLINENMTRFNSVGIHIESKTIKKVRTYKIKKYDSSVDSVDSVDSDNPFLS